MKGKRTETIGSVERETHTMQVLRYGWFGKVKLGVVDQQAVSPDIECHKPTTRAAWKLPRRGEAVGMPSPSQLPRVNELRAVMSRRTVRRSIYRGRLASSLH